MRPPRLTIVLSRVCSKVDPDAMVDALIETHSIVMRRLQKPAARTHMGSGDLDFSKRNDHLLAAVGADLAAHGRVLATIVWGDRAGGEFETISVITSGPALIGVWLGEEEHRQVRAISVLDEMATIRALYRSGK